MNNSAIVKCYKEHPYGLILIASYVFICLFLVLISVGFIIPSLVSAKNSAMVFFAFFVPFIDAAVCYRLYQLIFKGE